MHRYLAMIVALAVFIVAFKARKLNLNAFNFHIRHKRTIVKEQSYLLKITTLLPQQVSNFLMGFREFEIVFEILALHTMSLNGQDAFSHLIVLINLIFFLNRSLC